ncbi:MAG: class I SAM-dependent methyltransferase [Bacilli bacterium]
MSHYFENDNNLKEDKKIINVDMFGKGFRFSTNSGVFSKDKVDYGTKLLLNNIVIHKKSGKLLDLGCGYGVLGVILGENYKNLDIDMVDVNERAVALANYNLKLNGVNGVNCYVSNIYEGVNSKYDYIVTNPPIRAGKDVLLQFLVGSYDYLVSDGQLWFVMRKDHGVKTMILRLQELFDVQIVCRDKGFYIVKCVKKN